MSDKTTLRVTGMHCGNCGLLVDETLEDIAGVTRSETSVKRELTTVTHDVQMVSVQALVTAIEELGYAASRVDAR